METERIQQRDTFLALGNKTLQRNYLCDPASLTFLKFTGFRRRVYPNPYLSSQNNVSNEPLKFIEIKRGITREFHLVKESTAAKVGHK